MTYLIFGFDLGDGESLISYQKYNDSDSFVGYFSQYLEMPEQGHIGIPMPTCLCKNTNGDYVFNFNSINPNRFKDGIVNFKRQPTSFFESEIITDVDLENNSDFLEMKKKIVAFVNNAFPIAVSKLDVQEEIDKITICVGYPTKWNTEDVRLYKKILQESVIGKGTFHLGNMDYPSELLFFAESRAAFLYARNEYKSIWDMKKSRLLIDIGSSTIDVTAVSGNDRIYNDGNIFLGARIIDYLIRDFYYEKLKESEKYSFFIESITENPNIEKLFLFYARQVKEDFFDGILKNKNSIVFEATEDRLSYKFSIQELKNLIEQSYIINILTNELKIRVSGEDCDEKYTWVSAFENFLYKQKKELDNRNISIKEIILTGSASQMYFIPECCKKVFGEDINFAYDTHPGVSIASGLTMAGVATKLSDKFEQEAEKKVYTKIAPTVNSKIHVLAVYISEIISSYFEMICTSALLNWKQERIKSLGQVKYQILNNTSKNRINEYLKNHAEYQKFINDWNEGIKGVLVLELKGLSKKYNVNIDINIDAHHTSNTLNMSSNIDDVFFSLIDLLLPDIILNVMPNFLGAVFAFITLVVQGILRGLGIIVKKILDTLFDDDIKNPADIVQEKIMDADLPGWMRRKVSNEDLSDAVNSGLVTLKEKIITSIEEESNKKKIIRSVEEQIRPEIQNKVSEIKYIISGDIDINADIKSNSSGEVYQNNKNFNQLSLRNQLADRLEKRKKN